MALGAYQVEWILDRSRFKGMVKGRRIGGSHVVTKDAVLSACGYDPLSGGLDLSKGEDEFMISASQHQAEEMLRECYGHLEDLETRFTAVQAMIPLARRRGLPLVPDVLWAMYQAHEENGGNVAKRKGNRIGFKDMGKAVPQGLSRVKLIKEARSDRITLVNGKRIEARPANPATVRGCTGNLTFDEFGVMPHSYDIWGAAKPIVDPNWRNPLGFRLRVIGTPLGDDNMFYRLAKTDEGRAFSWHWIDVYRAVADGFPADINALRLEAGDEDIFRQEYCCQFLSASSRYIPSELLDTAGYDPTDPEILKMFDDAMDNVRAYGGMDVARSAQGDYTALVVVWKIGDIYWVRPNVWAERGVDFDTQKDVVTSEIKDNGVRRIALDRSAIGTNMAEDLEKKHKNKVEGVKFTLETKEDMVTRLRRLLETRKLRIPTSEEKLRRDLLSLKRLLTTAGNTRFDVERSSSSQGHGDRAWALALALHAAEGTDAPHKARMGWRQPRSPGQIVQQRSYMPQGRIRS